MTEVLTEVLKEVPEIVGRCQLCHQIVKGNKTLHSYQDCGKREHD